MKKKLEGCFENHNYVPINDTSLTAHTLQQMAAIPPKPPRYICTKVRQSNPAVTFKSCREYREASCEPKS